MSKAKTPEEKKLAAEAKAKAKADAEAKKAADKAAKEAEKSAKLGAGKDEVVVLDSKSGVSRTYSKAVHGADYKKLADEFASKVGTRKVL